MRIRPFLMPAAVAAAWAVTRLVLFDATLSGLVPMDVRLYRGWTSILWSGSFPTGDPTYQYPPGTGVAFMLLGDGDADFYRRLTLVALATDLLILVLLLVSSWRRGDRSCRGAWVWVVGGLAVGHFMYERYDLLPTLLAVAAILLIGRPRLSGALAGLGALVKVWPGLVLLGLPRRLLLRGAVASLLAAAGGWLVIAVFLRNSTSFLSNQSSRGLQVETVAAYPFMVAKALGAHVPVRYLYGSYEVDERAASAIVWILLGVTALLLGLILVWRLRGRLELVPPGDVVLAAVLVFVATSKVNSPQYAIWIIGVAAAALVDRRSRMLGVSVALVLMCYLTDQTFMEHYSAFLHGSGVATAYQGVRLVILVGCTVWALASVLRTRPVQFAGGLEAATSR